MFIETQRTMCNRGWVMTKIHILMVVPSQIDSRCWGRSLHLHHSVINFTSTKRQLEWRLHLCYYDGPMLVLLKLECVWECCGDLIKMQILKHFWVRAWDSAFLRRWLMKPKLPSWTTLERTQELNHLKICSITWPFPSRKKNSKLHIQNVLKLEFVLETDFLWVYFSVSLYPPKSLCGSWSHFLDIL